MLVGVARPLLQTIVRLFIADESPGESLKNPVSLRRLVSFADTLGI